MLCVAEHFASQKKSGGRNDTGNDQDPYETTDPDTLLKQLGAKTFMQDIANQY